jgi:hypothetical protein
VPRARTPPQRRPCELKRFAKRIALPEWELSLAVASMALSHALPRVVDEVIALATSPTIEDTQSAAVRLAAASILLQAGPIAPQREASPAQARHGPDGPTSATDAALSAKVASDPIASDLYRNLLDRIDALDGDGAAALPHGDAPRTGNPS